MKYPLGIQNFEFLRSEGYMYIDKTEFMFYLMHGGKYFFLGRPRRFGKSLLVSTLEAYLSGRKDLFDGLAISEIEKEWTAYPVLHIDLNTGRYETEEELTDVLNMHVSLWEKKYGKDPDEQTLPVRFMGVIRRAYEQTGRGVAILVDEYDKPLLLSMGNAELQDKYRGMLKAFYSVMKTQDRYIKFGFLTGVTKFGKVSVFSDLNNITDISMDERYATICGITEEEMLKCFDGSIKELAAKNEMSFNEACRELKERYDGYHFHVNSVGVYNPYSLLNALDKRELGDYWFETGTPTFLVKMLQRDDFVLGELNNVSVPSDDLKSTDPNNPVSLLYQSGYLTIKGYDKMFNEYVLDYPNREVERGFIKALNRYYIPRERLTRFSIKEFVKDVMAGKPEQFMRRLSSLYADADYEVVGDMELYFQNTLYLIFKMMGFFVEVERRTSEGRIDVVVQTRDYIYIIECKLDGSAAEALAQIEDKGYAKPFEGDTRKLYKLGVNFSTATRGVAEYKIV